MFFLRSVSRAAGAVAALFLFGLSSVHAQSLPDGFAPDVAGTVNAMDLVPVTGQMILGGSFTQVAGQNRQRLARVNHDGSLDAGFAPSVNATVSAVAVQANGNVLIGGGFSQVNGQAQNRLARLQTNGTLDASFNPNPNGEVRAIVVLPSGQLLVGGFFTTIAGQTRNHVALLNADGTLDASFNPNVNGSVYALRRMSDGRVLVGGSFSAVGGSARQNLARLTAAGALDAAFGNPVLVGGTVFAVDAQADGMVVAGGGFTTASGISHPRIVRLRTDGTPDPAFAANANNTVSTLLVQPDGRLLLGGLFTQINATARSRLARLLPNGDLDPDFAATADSDVLASLIAGDGRLIVAGAFSHVGAAVRHRLARLSLDGQLDTDSTLTVGGTPFAYPRFVSTLADGGALVMGLFAEVNGTPQIRAAKIRADDSLDPGFLLTLDQAVPYAVVPLPDGRAVLGGSFTVVNGQPVSDVVAVAPNGALDPTFSVSDSYDGVNAVVPLDEGQLLVAGKGKDVAHHLTRLLADGSEDPAFALGADGEVTAAAAQPDGTVIIAGAFTHIGPRSNPAGGTARQGVARLTASGDLDLGFAPALSNLANPPRLFSPQDDGRILVGLPQAPGLLRLFPGGGLDASLTTTFDSGLSSLVRQADGRFYVAGTYTSVNGTSSYGPQRLNTVGVIDPTFVMTSDGQTYLFVQRADGKLWGGGQFSTIDGQPRDFVYRLSATTPAVQALTWNDAQRTALWTQGKASPAVVRPPVLELSLDGTTFTEVGSMTRFGTFWSLSKVPVPTGMPFYLRVRAYTAGGFYGNGYSLLYSTLQAYSAGAPSDRIFANGFEG